MAKKKKRPLQAALEYLPSEQVLMGLGSAIPEPEPKQSLLGKIIKAPFRLILKVIGMPFSILGTLVRGLRRSR